MSQSFTIRPGQFMALKSIATPHAPGAIGPYSQGIIANGFLYTAGQIALDPQTGQIVDGGIQEQTTRVMSNLKGILEAAGLTFSDVVKTTVFLVDMNDFVPMNEMYAKAFGDHKPARSTVAVSGLPRGVRVEIEVIALAK
jgi:2-iminobutanoate/2-iminopropanoate deaminase